jgi:cytochrome P450
MNQMSERDPFEGTAFEGFRHITDYRKIEGVLKARAPAPHRRPSVDHLEQGTLLKIHGDRHSHRRRLEGALFRPEVLEFYSREVLGPTIDRVVDGLVVERDPDGLVRADFVAVGQRIVMELTGTMIGLDNLEKKEKAEDIYQFLVDFTEGIKVEYSTEDQSAVIRQAAESKRRYWEEYVKPARDRRLAILADQGKDALPRDLISLILTDANKDKSWVEEWDDDLLLRECILYLVGAGATTVALSAHAAVDLCRWMEANSTDWDQISDDLVAAAVAEALRLHPPFHALVRDCPEDVHLPELTLNAGDALFIDVVTANQDEKLFGKCPENFDPHREVQSGVPPYGLAFGLGRHFCIGRPLALGGRGTGTHGSLFMIVRKMMDVGMTLDPQAPPQLAKSMESRYVSVPAIFHRL